MSRVQLRKRWQAVVLVRLCNGPVSSGDYLGSPMELSALHLHFARVLVLYSEDGEGLWRGHNTYTCHRKSILNLIASLWGEKEHKRVLYGMRPKHVVSLFRLLRWLQIGFLSNTINQKNLKTSRVHSPRRWPLQCRQPPPG